MPIVTLSHEIGAGGPEIGQKLAERLSLHYVDQELISQAALRYGLLEQKLSNLDEAKPSLFERFDAETRRYITVLQTALYEFAEKDRVVLMGRSGQWLLRGIPHVLRVRVMAPFDLRIKHLGKRLSGQMGEHTNPRMVHDMARRDDTEKHGEALDRRRRGAHRWRAPAPRHGHHAGEPATRRGPGACLARPSGPGE